jgi:hypothetical protein
MLREGFERRHTCTLKGEDDQVDARSIILLLWTDQIVHAALCFYANTAFVNLASARSVRTHQFEGRRCASNIGFVKLVRPVML